MKHKAQRYAWNEQETALICEMWSVGESLKTIRAAFPQCTRGQVETKIYKLQKAGIIARHSSIANRAASKADAPPKPDPEPKGSIDWTPELDALMLAEKDQGKPGWIAPFSRRIGVAAAEIHRRLIVLRPPKPESIPILHIRPTKRAGRRHCISCKKDFHSVDRILNQLCPSCCTAACSAISCGGESTGRRIVLGGRS